MANSNGWGDGAANNAIGWGQGANNNIGWGKSHSTSNAGLTDIVGLTTDSDAQAFITAAAITNATQQSAIDTLVKGLKTDGIWTKMKAIYPFVGGTASTHKYNLKDPRDLDAAFRLQFNGGITHSSTGVLPNGTNGYANTFFIPSVQIANADSFHFSIYSRTNGAWTYPDIGAIEYDGDGNYYVVQSFYGINANGGNTTLWHGNNNARGFLDTNSLGLYVGNRNLTGSATAFKNGVLKLTNSAGSALSAGVPMSLMALLGEFYGRRELAFSTLGTGLTNTDNTNLYTRIQTFQTTLSRQV